jgi:hypothetical protein
MGMIFLIENPVSRLSNPKPGFTAFGGVVVSVVSAGVVDGAAGVAEGLELGSNERSMPKDESTTSVRTLFACSTRPRKFPEMPSGTATDVSGDAIGLLCNGMGVRSAALHKNESISIDNGLTVEWIKNGPHNFITITKAQCGQIYVLQKLSNSHEIDKAITLLAAHGLISEPLGVQEIRH